MPDAAPFLLLIEPEANSGAWNMAVDEALLEAASQQNLTAVRFYRWNAPTLSLGYFQKSLPDNLPAELRQLAQVRRLSGGGAILHHLEWTYSCVLPPEHPLAVEPVNFYEHVHRELINLLSELEIHAALRGSAAADPSNKTFLCFGRQDPRDIVFGPHKIVGSAQRRRRGAVLQHGSLLLRRSPFAPEYPGLLDLDGNAHCGAGVSSKPCRASRPGSVEAPRQSPCQSRSANNTSQSYRSSRASWSGTNIKRSSGDSESYAAAVRVSVDRRGRCTRKVLPWPGPWLLASIVPPWSPMIRWLIDMPSPVPLPSRRCV